MNTVRRIAWAGISFDVPANWELGLYKFLRRGVRRVEVEDEFSVRIELEWVRPRRAASVSQIMQRYEVAARKMTMKADVHRSIDRLPPGWTATLYRFSETVPKRRTGGLQVVKHALVTAFFLEPDASLFAFCMLHFLPEDKEHPEQVARLLVDNFRNHSREAVVPWELFDIQFALPSDFELEATRFNVGAKLMIFRRRLRRLYLWYFSCADRFLKPGDDVNRWLAAYFNDSYLVRGGSFCVEDDAIRWRRHRRHFIGHRDELARGCFRYVAAWRRDPERNQLIAWVYNYRHPDDLSALPVELRSMLAQSGAAGAASAE